MQNYSDEQSCLVQAMRQRKLHLDNEGEYWSEHEKERLRLYFNRGEGITEMAILLCRSEPAIMQQIEKMDLYGRKTNPQRRKGAKRPSCLCSVCQLPETLCSNFRNCASCPEEEHYD